MFILVRDACTELVHTRYDTFYYSGPAVTEDSERYNYRSMSNLIETRDKDAHIHVYGVLNRRIRIEVYTIIKSTRMMQNTQRNKQNGVYIKTLVS